MDSENQYKHKLNVHHLITAALFLTIFLVLAGALYVSFADTDTSAVPSVQGISVDELTNPGLPYYSVYAKPDKNSDVLHYAQEGDKFVVLDEKQGWYQVIVRGDIVGWLSSDDIRSREILEK